MSELLKNSLAVFIGFILSILIIYSAEKMFSLWMDFHPLNCNYYPQKNVPYGLGWVPPKDKTIPHKKIVNNTLIFDTSYTIDHVHRRVTPSSQFSDSAKEFILFFGGSNVFGTGLADDQTIPERLQQKLEHRYQVYNYGGEGYGPQQMLLKLQSGSLKQEINQKTGLILYQYYQFHIDRVIGRMSIIKWAGGKHPYFSLDEKDELHLHGSFAEGRPIVTRLYWFLSKSSIVDYFNINIPPRLSTKHYELTCQILKESRHVATKQFPESSFVVLLAVASSTNDIVVDTCLKKNNIDFYDLRIPYFKHKNMVFKHDGHLNKDGAQYTADKLAELLNTNSMDN